jgi:hypothetical protein
LTRAALRLSSREPARALALGEATRSQIDAVSIPSAVFISAPDGSICFGQQALERGLAGKPSLLFEASPKRWLTAGRLDELLAPAAEGVTVSRCDLLSGLVAHALSACCAAAVLPPEALFNMEVRIAHPVWALPQRADANRYLNRIAVAAMRAAGQTDAEMTPAALLEALATRDESVQTPTVDVVEPIAAAVELFANPANARQLCAVIDVGAGTIDLALLISVTPDESARGTRRKLIPLADPRSLFAAGDVIDEEVIALVQDSAEAPFDSAEHADLVRLKRSLKETLFRTGRLSRSGTTIALRDLEQRPRMRRMAQELGSTFVQLVQGAASRIAPYVDTNHHAVDRIHTIFAGGGAGIEFLRRRRVSMTLRHRVA